MERIYHNVNKSCYFIYFIDPDMQMPKLVYKNFSFSQTIDTADTTLGRVTNYFSLLVGKYKSENKTFEAKDPEFYDCVQK
jgi:hypothetical protein